MKLHARIFAACLPLTVFAGGATATDQRQPVTDCVTLGDRQEVIRNSGPTHFFLRDGDRHYRVEYRQSCSAAAISSKFEISADGQANRLCPGSSRVATNREICRVGKVEQISAEDYAKAARRARRS